MVNESPGSNSNSLRMESDSISSDGMVEIKSGRVKVINPQGNGKAATFIVGEGAKLRINGAEIEDRSFIHAEDLIELEAVSETISPTVNIKISPDKMMAEIKTTPETKVQYTLLDQDFRNIISVKTEKEEMVTRAITAEEIKEALDENGIVYGIDDDVINELSSTLDPATMIVASGDPMEEGKDGFVEYLIQKEIEAVEYNEEEVKVDYRERYSIPQVNEGDIIAIIHPPVEGIPGKDITGVDIPAPPVKEAAVNLQEGVKLSDDATQVVALLKGRPVIKQGREHIISIEKFYVHSGDVDMESGNIRFQGNLKIVGNVEDGMTIFADGDMIITKNAAGAKILAGGSVNIEGNCINCQVEAGGLKILCEELAYLLEMVRVSLEMASDNIEQIVQTLKARGQFSSGKFPYVLQTLLQTKYAEIPEYLEQIKALLKEKSDFTPPSTAMDRIKALLKFFLENGLMESKDETKFMEMYRNIDEATTIIQSIATTNSNITVFYAQNSDLKCTGDIVVSGTGAYNSNFLCEGSVQVEKLFRGGNINAEGNIIIGELGSPGSSRSQGIIKIPDDKTIKLSKVYEGTRLKVGERQFRLDSTYSNIKVFLDKGEDKVKVSYWK